MGSQAKKEKLPALRQRPRARKQLLSSQGSNPSSQASDYQSEERQQDSFIFHRLNRRLEPIIENPQIVFENELDTDESCEEPGELEETVMKCEEGQHELSGEANDDIPGPTIMDIVSLAEAGDQNEDAEEPLSFRTLVKPENIENENEKKTDIHGV